MFGLGAIIQGITGFFGNNIIGKLFGNKEAREQAVHEEQTDVLNEFASENIVRDNRTKFDSFIDGINRLPRPIGFFSTVAILIWPAVDPVSFAVIVSSWSLIPAWMCQLIMGVWALYFGGRIISKDLKFTGLTTAAVQEVIEHQKDLKALFADKSNNPAPDVPRNSSGEFLNPSSKISDGQYRKELADTSKPLSLPAIERWNQLHGSEKTP